MCETGGRALVNTEQAIPDCDELYELLSNRRRRCVLYYLQRRPDEQVALSDLSTQVAAWESAISPEQVTYDQRKSVHTSLYQHHLPKLAQAGVVEYDSRRGTLSLTESGASIQLYSANGTDQHRWAVALLGISTASGMPVGLCLVGFGPGFMAAVPDIVWGGLAAAAFVITSILFACEVSDWSLPHSESSGAPPELAQQNKP